MRLQLNLRDDCLARGINLKEEFQTQFLKNSNNLDETPKGAICHLCLSLRGSPASPEPAEARLNTGDFARDLV